MSSSKNTIFYSWQSDTGNKYNRGFIEAALQEAIRRIHDAAARLESAERPELALDKDTQGVTGSPPIVETILRKIDACAVFVADLTFTGQSLPELREDTEPRYFPNPNVLIEHGYAVARHGHQRVIAVMNAAFGGTVKDHLPFDLKHLRWPIVYCYGPNSKDRDAQLEQLVKILAGAIGALVTEPPPAAAAFIAQDITVSQLAEMGRELVPDGPLRTEVPDFKLPTRAVCTLRVHPVAAVLPLQTEFEALQHVVHGNLRPMAGTNTHGQSPSRNSLGAISYESPTRGRLDHLSQLLLAKEIFGVDTASMASVGRTGDEVVFDPVFVEASFAMSLDEYVRFARKELQLPGPLVVSAALLDIKNYATMPGRRTFRSSIEWKGEYHEDVPTWRFLRQFFEHIWKCFGMVRPENTEEALLSTIPSSYRLPPLKKLHDLK